MRIKYRLILASVICLLAMVSASGAYAATNNDDKQQIKFNSFTGIYHLSRDSRGLSLLSAEETIIADFPASGYSGITRSIPKSFQGRSIDLKVLNVVNEAGTPVPFKTKTDKDNNLVITTGDPDIVLAGFETIKINYQTRGVINLDAKSVDEFLLNVNGRGWSQGIGKIDAILYVPSSFNAQIVGKPACYTSIGSKQLDRCSLSVEKHPEHTKISAQVEGAAPNEAMIIKTDFKGDTFTNVVSLLTKYKTPLLIAGLTLAFISVTGLIMTVFKVGEDKPTE